MILLLYSIRYSHGWMVDITAAPLLLLFKTITYSDAQFYNDYYTYDYNVPSGLVTCLELEVAELNESIRPVAGEKS